VAENTNGRSRSGVAVNGRDKAKNGGPRSVVALTLVSGGLRPKTLPVVGAKAANHRRKAEKFPGHPRNRLVCVKKINSQLSQIFQLFNGRGDFVTLLVNGCWVFGKGCHVFSNGGQNLQ